MLIRNRMKNKIQKANKRRKSKINAPISFDMNDIKILSFKLLSSISPEYLKAVSIPVIKPIKTRVKKMK